MDLPSLVVVFFFVSVSVFVFAPTLFGGGGYRVSAIARRVVRLETTRIGEERTIELLGRRDVARFSIRS